MHPILAHIHAIESGDERSAALGEFLGLGRGAPLAALERATTDETFAFYLVMSRNNPHALTRLLAPYAADAAPIAAPARPSPPPADVSSATLLRKAGGALTRWMASGFATVTDEAFERRFRACEACENLVEAPSTALYRIALTRASDRRICSACGCAAARKARLATEHCPAPMPDDPAVNRWGERFP